MRSPVFGNEFFDQWLNQKSNDILAKVEHQKISNEDMLILSLKAQVNHFHHMDIEFREEFKNIGMRFERIDNKFEKIDKRFEEVDKRFESLEYKLDKRFDRLTTILMWGCGIFITSQMALWLKIHS